MSDDETGNAFVQSLKLASAKDRHWQLFSNNDSSVQLFNPSINVPIENVRLTAPGVVKGAQHCTWPRCWPRCRAATRLTESLASSGVDGIQNSMM